MKKGIKIFGLTLFGLILLVNCEKKIDRENFDFEKHISANDEIIKELESWNVDTAYIQFIGFPPSKKEEIEQLSQDGKLNPSILHYFVDPKGFFDFYDFEQPIIKVWALRKIAYSGNSFNDAGVGSADIVDYENGIGRSDAKNLHSAGDYSGETYVYADYYLASLQDNFIKGHEKLLMLMKQYSDDMPGINFFDDVINLNTEFANEREFATKKVGLYVKGKGIVIVEPTRLQLIQSKILSKNSAEASAIVSDSLAYAATLVSDSLAKVSSKSDGAEVSGSVKH